MSTDLPLPRQAPRTAAQDQFAALRQQLNSRSFRERVASGVPEEFRTVGYVDRLVESIFIACRDSVASGRPGVQTLLDCDRASLFRAAERIAKRGLTVGDNVAWLVPYKGQVQDQLGYKGAMILVRRSKAVTRITAQPVFANDICEILLGAEQKVAHKPLMTGDRGKLLGVYAIADVHGEPEIEWMSISDIEKIRQNAPSKNSPAWQNSYSEMARAKVLKRLCKRLPTERPIDLDDMDEAASQTIEGRAEPPDVEVSFDTQTDVPSGQEQDRPAIDRPSDEPMDAPEILHDPETGEVREPEPARQAQPARPGRARGFSDEG